MASKARLRRRKVYKAFLDLKKKYDRIDREGLWKTLKYMEWVVTAESYLNFYVNSEAHVGIRGKKSDWLKGTYSLFPFLSFPFLPEAYVRQPRVREYGDDMDRYLFVLVLY